MDADIFNESAEATLAEAKAPDGAVLLAWNGHEMDGVKVLTGDVSLLQTAFRPALLAS